MTKKIKLGMKVKDRVTGWEGIAIARTLYMQGCDRILVQCPMDKDNNIPEPQHFDEPDLEIVNDGIYVRPKKETEEDPGGPHRGENRITR